MINNVLTVGCSFTYGDELADRTNQAWPYLLAKSNEWTLTNLGKSSGSNDRSVRVIFDEISKNYDLIVVAWTFHDRFEVKSGDIGGGALWPKIPPAERREWKWAEEYFKYSYDKSFSFAKYLRQVIMLQSYLKQQNQKYIFCNVFCMWTDLQPEFDRYRQEYDYLIKQVDQTYFIDWPLGSMLQWQGQCPKGSGGHPLELGHQRIADKINEHIRHLGWIS
jgi:hypothetical protein